MINGPGEKYDPDVKDGPTTGAVGEAFAACLNPCPPIPH